MRLVPPISVPEFLQLLQRTAPPRGWSPRIAVANSGGPDSTALLFLLTALQKQYGIEANGSTFDLLLRLRHAHLGSVALPREVLSIHVNHGLQSAASDMELIASRTATQLGARSMITAIPWGTAPFPPLSANGSVDEKVARETRYNRLFAALQANKTRLIAFAHHADDQVETAVMRMTLGSSGKGLAGMRPVRRWGMGKRASDSAYYNFGLDGMGTWIVRPFLQIPKDRLLATCEANKLDYVNDPTNFQPDLTVRNAVRHKLATNDMSPIEGVPNVERVDIAPCVGTLRAMVPHVRPEDQLREATRLFGIHQDEVELQVSSILKKAKRRSAPGTLVLASPDLAAATSPEVRTALIRRCLRYVSFGPWGSLWAEAGGDRAAYRRIAAALWPDPAPDDAPTPAPRRTFTLGAGVVAHPVAVLNRERGATRERPPQADHDECEGWRFSRERPYQHPTAGPPKTSAATAAGAGPGVGAGATAASLPNGTRNGLPGVLDITREVLTELEGRREPLSVLFDARFAVTLDLRVLPRGIEQDLRAGARMKIDFDGKYWLPKITVTTAEKTKDVAKYVENLRERRWTVSLRPGGPSQPWARMAFVRSLDAI